jgi:ribonuclease P protein component
MQRREDFAQALASGVSGARRHFLVYARPNSLPCGRIGIIAGKRVAPNAVDRNRVKRMVREAFRLSRPLLHGLDIVVQLRRRPGRGARAAVRAELEKLLNELRISAQSR